MLLMDSCLVGFFLTTPAAIFFYIDHVKYEFAVTAAISVNRSAATETVEQALILSNSLFIHFPPCFFFELFSESRGCYVFVGGAPPFPSLRGWQLLTILNRAFVYFPISLFLLPHNHAATINEFTPSYRSLIDLYLFYRNPPSSLFRCLSKLCSLRRSVECSCQLLPFFG